LIEDGLSTTILHTVSSGFLRNILSDTFFAFLQNLRVWMTETEKEKIRTEPNLNQVIKTSVEPNSNPKRSVRFGRL